MDDAIESISAPISLIDKSTRNGSLHIKQGNSPWTSMYAILQVPERKLYLYASRDDFQPKEVIELSKWQAHNMDDSCFKRPFCFQLIQIPQNYSIVSVENKGALVTINFHVESPNAKNEWLQDFSTACHCCSKCKLYRDEVRAASGDTDTSRRSSVASSQSSSPRQSNSARSENMPSPQLISQSISSQLSGQIVQKSASPIDISRKPSNIGRMLEDRQAAFRKKSQKSLNGDGRIVMPSAESFVDVMQKKATLVGSKSTANLASTQPKAPGIPNAKSSSNIAYNASNPILNSQRPPIPGQIGVSIPTSRTPTLSRGSLFSSNDSLSSTKPPETFSNELPKRSITMGIMGWRDFDFGSDEDLSSATAFYCILFTDNVKFAKTRISTADSKSWSEEFSLDSIPQCHENLRIIVFASSASTYQKIGYINLKYGALKNGLKMEDWYPIIPIDGRPIKANPSVRINYSYSTYQKLSMRTQNKFLDLVIEPDFTLVKLMDQFVGSRREEFSRAFVIVLMAQGRESEGILSLLRHEVEKATNHKILFRGNSVTTKTMDQYMKLVGSDYLYTTLHSMIEHLYSLSEGCEVDPNKMNGKKDDEKEKLAKKNMKILLDNVEAVTYAIFKSVEKFPP
jgi:hypothetical protein